MKKNHLVASILLLVQCALLPVAQAQTDEPEQRIFYVSAYYSPVEGQSFYLRGDFESEKKLNGNGIRGASGQAVHSGMLAAPKSYSFGTKIKLEGVGIGTVEDRGGAIVEAGQRGNSYDRIDIWMGEGEEGLKRALSWGLRKVVGYVYPPGTALLDSIDLDHFTIAKANWPSGSGLTLLKRNLGKGSTGDDVQKLQEILVELGYLEEDPGEMYDNKTIDAVYRFQVAQNIVKADTNVGAGYAGEKTRKALEKAWYAFKEQERKQLVALRNEKQQFINTFPTQLGKTKGNSDDVLALQKALQELQYDVALTGRYDQKTINAVLQFQMAKGVVGRESDFGAGYFGNQTKLFLAEAVWQQRQKNPGNQVASSASLSKTTTETVAVVREPSRTEPFSQDLSNQSKGGAVIELQNALTVLGFLDAAATGYYGPKTEEAVLNFQMRYQLVGSAENKGAGIFGPLTREKFKQVWSRYQDRKIARELDMGDKGIEVAKVQNILQKLGYFQPEVTGTFGPQTQAALLQFQLDTAVIEKEDSLGAGRVGKATIEALNQKLATLL